jgi:2,3-bisphosphoglycerate-independent phosphoglycerate mutase
MYVADDAEQFSIDAGILADVAPTILVLLGLEQPAQMTGRNLLVRTAT